MVVVLPPRAFLELDALARWLGTQIAIRRHRPRAVRGELTQDTAEPIDALEPPVAEELGVERHREQRGAILRAALCERVADQLHEMIGVRAHALGRGAWRVHRFVPKPGLHVGHTPVPQTAPIVLAVELAIRRVAGVPHHRGPHLPGDRIVSRDRGDLGVTHEIRSEHVDRVGIDERRGHAGARVTAREAMAFGNETLAAEERRVDEEVREPI